MAKGTIPFEFVIDGFTPDTLPMARLAEYLTDLANLLGEKNAVHFDRVGEGSASLLHRVDEPAEEKVRHRIAGARIVGSDSEERRAYESLDRRLREDKALAELRVPTDTANKLLYFPGRMRAVESTYGPFNQEGELYGTIIQVGGRQKLANVNIEDGDRTYFCEASRDLALQMAPLMYNHVVRVTGVGRYLRNSDSEWEMKSFRIHEFDKLDRRPLAETVERLRGITRKIGMDKDILKKLADLRGDPSEA